MSKRIYSTKATPTEEFPNYDGHGWFKEISTDEFTTLLNSGKIRHASGRYFATGSFDEAKSAAEGMGPAPREAAYENPEPKPDTSFTTSPGGIYANPGATLKGIASAIFYIELVVSIIIAFALGAAAAVWGSSFNFGVFFIVLLVGVLVSYLSGLGLAALGDIAKNLNEINRKIK